VAFRHCSIDGPSLQRPRTVDGRSSNPAHHSPSRISAPTRTRAKAFFATVNAANRYAVLWRIQTAVKADTRATRIAQLVDMLARGETIHAFKPKAKA